MVALAVVDLAWLMPNVFSNLVWNPNFGFVFLMASIAFAWVVGLGDLRWLPLLVVSSSVAAQSHLIFVPAVVLVAVISSSLGIIRSGRGDRTRGARARWLVIGSFVGIVCWSFPLLQQTTGTRGNISTLASAPGTGSLVGTGFTLRLLNLAFSPIPIVLRRFPSEYSLGALAKPSTFPSSIGWGFLIGLTLGTLLLVWRAPRPLATLALISWAYTVAIFATFVRVPSQNVLNLPYVCFCWWLAGLLVWIAVIGTLVWLLSRGRSQHGAERTLPSSRNDAILSLRLPSNVGRRGWPQELIVTVAIVIVGIVGVLQTVHASAAEVQAGGYGVPISSSGPATEQQIQQVTAVIEHEVPKGPVTYRIDIRGRAVKDVIGQEGVDAAGVLWKLTLDGWQPGFPANLTIWTPEYPAAEVGAPVVTVSLTCALHQTCVPKRVNANPHHP
jgi:hypothetical protein